MPEPVKCLGERFQDAFLRGWGDDRLVAYADLPAEAQAKWNRAALAFVCTLSDAPSELKSALQEARAALRLARDFAEQEIECRGYAGGEMTDYQDEAQRVFDACDAVLFRYSSARALSPGGADE